MPMLPGTPIFWNFPTSDDWQRMWTAWVYGGDKYKPNEKDIQLIGVETPEFLWSTDKGPDSSTGDNAFGSLSSKMSIDTFDYTTRADSAQIRLVADGGVTVKLKAAAIKAFPVMRWSGAQGFLHDSFVDYDDIYQSGENKFEFGNNYVVSGGQLESLADYWWKFLRSARHIYSVTLPGARYDFEPGDWYTLKVGGAGEREYIDSVCEVYAMATGVTAGGASYTSLALREVYQNWTKDSGAVARFIATGDPRQLPANFGRVVVASAQYMGPADYYCDGTADQTEIQAAIDQVAGLGGGLVQLTEGTFNITAAVDLSYHNIVLMAAGARTRIEKNCNDYAIKVVGISGTEIENVVIRDLYVTRNAADTNSKYLIYASYADHLTVQGCTAYDSYSDAIYCSDCDDLVVTFNMMSDNVSDGLHIYNSVSGQITNNTSNGAGGIYIGNSLNLIVSGNTCTGCSGAGIYILGGQGCVITNNNSSGNEIGIRLDGSVSAGWRETIHNVIANNRCHDNYLYDAMAIPDYGVALFYGGWGICITPMADFGHFLYYPISTKVLNNSCEDNGNFLDRSGCEDVAPPAIRDEETNTLTNCTFARSGSQACTGDYSYLFTRGATATVASAYLTTVVTSSDLHGLVNSAEYTFSAYLYIPSSGGPQASEVTLVIRDCATVATWSESALSATATYDAWMQTSVTRTIASTATGVTLGFKVANTAATELFYVDNLRLLPVGAGNLHNQNFWDAGQNTYAGI